MSEESLVLMSIDAGIALIHLNEPSSRNALSESMADELVACLKQAEAEARVVVLTGTGKGFCSGAKLGKPKGDVKPEEIDLGLPLREVYNPLMTLIRNLSIPIVTAVNGAAAGMGYSLAVSGDIVVAAESAKFVLAFSKIGLAPDGGVSYHLVKTIGRARAMELALFDERVSASQAYEWGLINRVVADENLMDTAMEMAGRLANGPTLAYKETRKLVWQAAESSLSELLELEAVVQKTLGRSEDHRSGVKSFLLKEKPEFTGR